MRENAWIQIPSHFGDSVFQRVPKAISCRGKKLRYQICEGIRGQSVANKGWVMVRCDIASWLKF
jgi:hypothetical protein